MRTPGIFAHMSASPHTLANAWAEGVIERYLVAYKEVMQQLEAERATSLLVGPVNTLLERMARTGKGCYDASVDLMNEMSSPRTRYFVMAAAVDIVMHERKPGEKVTRIASMKETLAKAEGQRSI